MRKLRTAEDEPVLTCPHLTTADGNRPTSEETEDSSSVFSFFLSSRYR